MKHLLSLIAISCTILCLLNPGQAFAELRNPDFPRGGFALDLGVSSAGFSRFPEIVYNDTLDHFVFNELNERGWGHSSFKIGARAGFGPYVTAGVRFEKLEHVDYYLTGGDFGELGDAPSGGRNLTSIHRISFDVSIYLMQK